MKIREQARRSGGYDTTLGCLTVRRRRGVPWRATADNESRREQGFRWLFEGPMKSRTISMLHRRRGPASYWPVAGSGRKKVVAKLHAQASGAVHCSNRKTLEIDGCVNRFEADTPSYCMYLYPLYRVRFGVRPSQSRAAGLKAAVAALQFDNRSFRRMDAEGVLRGTSLRREVATRAHFR